MADVVFQMAEGRPVTDDLRARLAGRIPSLGLRSLVPFAGSLARDPQYSSAYYLAADSLVDDKYQSFLLYLTLASAPANPVYPASILIGRLRPGGGREVVVNAVPFGIKDGSAIRLYVEKVESGFLPRPGGVQTSIAVTVGEPVRDLPVAFDAFRQIRKATGANLASFCAFGGAPTACAWAAIRAGWRHGYSLETAVLSTTDDPAPLAAEGYTSFRIDASGAETSAIIGFVSKMRRVRRQADIEVCWSMPVGASELSACLESLKAAGVSPQHVSAPNAVEDVAELAPIVRSAGATLGVSAAGLTPDSARAFGRVAGRFRCRLESPVGSADEIVTLAAQLRA